MSSETRDAAAREVARDYAMSKFATSADRIEGMCREIATLRAANAALKDALQEIAECYECSGSNCREIAAAALARATK